MGTVTSTPISGTVDIGNAITGSFSYDDTSGDAPFGTDAILYTTNHVSSFSVNSLSGSRDDQFIIIVDSTSGDLLQSRGHTGAYTGDLLDGNSVTQISIRFGDTTGSVFSSTALPSTLNESDFDLKNGSLSLSGFTSSPNDRINFDVDSFTTSVSAVPVPAAVWLMGSALAGLVGFKRKKAA